VKRKNGGVRRENGGARVYVCEWLLGIFVWLLRDIVSRPCLYYSCFTVRWGQGVNMHIHSKHIRGRSVLGSVGPLNMDQT